MKTVPAHIQITDAKMQLADIYMELTGTDPNDEQAFAEFCSEAEGFLEDWLEDWLEKHEVWMEKYGQSGSCPEPTNV